MSDEPSRGGKPRRAVVGRGIVGVAVARHLLAAVPGARVTLLENEPELAVHQTRHNSGVVHAGPITHLGH